MQDFDGNALDGEWTNPSSIESELTSSEFPSGDNAAGGDFGFVFTINSGDFNRDGLAIGADMSLLLSNWNGTNKTFGQGDATGNGVVNGSDMSVLLSYYGIDFRDLLILGDYDADFDLDTADETAFLSLFNAQDESADLNGDSSIDQDDYDAFYELYGLGIELTIV